MQLSTTNNQGLVNYAFYMEDESKIKRPKTQIAVQIKNLVLSYGSQKVLDSINMNVPANKIYGLLGPSGCGKTSLLRCLIGIRKANSGQILVYGKSPQTKNSGIPGPGLGYTPQEVALFLDFTIEETFQYFGKIYHIHVEKIKQTTDSLVSLLKLPDKSRYIKSLSGGQKRRVSLAVALIHSPPLLILDEPTVGVDPVLRKNIWDHLQMLTQQMNLTIIITTQYIEEARSADLVSFMRNGKLLAERNPDDLMDQMKLTSLESVFLSLCQEDSTSMVVDCLDEQQASLALTNHSHPLKRQVRFAFLNRIMALNWKNLTAIRRNLSMLIIQFLMPSFQCLLNFTCLGPEPYNLPVAIFNGDKPSIMSNLFLNELNNVTITMKYYETLNEAIDQVRQGLAWAAIQFQANYTRSMQQALDDNGKIAQINVHIDTTSYVITNTINKNLWLAFNQSLHSALKLFDSNNSTEQDSFQLQQNPFNLINVYGGTEGSMSEFMAPGLIAMAIFFAAMALTAITLVLERKDGVFERTLVAGVKTFEFVVSQITTQLLVLAVQVLLSIITMFYIIDIENQGSIWLVYFITLMQGMCGMALGLVVSAFSQNESQALALAMASFLPISIISGIFWPVEAMPIFMKPISYLGPQTLSLDAMRAVISRGWTLQSALVIRGLISCTVWFFIFVIAASLGFHAMSFH